MNREHDSREISYLLAGSKAVGADLSETQARSLLNFLDRFYQWNGYCGFTRIRREQAVRLHLIDSLSVVGELVGAKTVADLGSGGGMPGIPLSMVLVDSVFTLVETRGRRCTFLREVVRDFGLSERVRIFEGDAWEVGHEGVRFDAVVARAFLPPEKLLVLGSRLVAPSGRVVVMGSDDAWINEAIQAGVLGDLKLGLTSERTFLLPGGTEARRVFRFEPAS